MGLSDDPLAKHIMASLQLQERKLQEIASQIFSINQQMKHLMFLMAKDAEPFNKMPKGESRIMPCERCGSMTAKEDMLSKSELQGNDITIFKMCRRCFYGKRTSGKAEVSLPEM